MERKQDNEYKINGERGGNLGHATFLNMREGKGKERFQVDF